MSSLLEQAIIDAKMLKETARKNAEAQILEERAEEIKRKIEMLFEEEDPLAGLGSDTATTAPALGTTPAAGEAKPEVKKVMDKIPPSYLDESEGEIEINLDSLIEKVSQLEEEVAPKNIGRLPSAEMQVEGGLAGQEDIGEEQLEEGEGDTDREAAAMTEKTAADMKAKAAAQRAAGAAKDKRERETAERETAERESKKVGMKSSATTQETELYEEFTLEEDNLEEEITLDMENVEEGGLNNFIKLKRQHDVKKALEAQEEENKELAEALVEKATEAAELEEQLNAAIAKLQETKEKLKNSVQLNVQLKEGVQMLTQKVSEVNLLNARLLYTNKTLGNPSLNERQKSQIAESVSRARTVDEAKTIYETLQRSVGEVSERRSAPQSLTEAINRNSAPFLPRKENPTVDPMKARWQAIAGIKSKN